MLEVSEVEGGARANDEVTDDPIHEEGTNTSPRKTLDTGCNFNEDSKNHLVVYGALRHRERTDLLDMHPGHLKFKELIKSMTSVVVPGLDVDGVMGAIEGIHFPGHTPEEDTTSQPLANSLVSVHYAMFLEGETLPFDNSLTRLRGKPARMKASSKEIIPGMAAALRWLKAGQRGRFIIAPRALFGDVGLYPIIPANTSVLLLLHSINHLDAGAIARYDDLDPESKKDFNVVKPYVESINNVARDYFTYKKITFSYQTYEKSIEILQRCTPNKCNQETINALKAKTYVNLAVCMDLLGNSRDAIFYLDQASVLEDYLKNCKALFLRGRSHLKLAEYEEAKEYLLNSFEMEPFNEEIGAELEKLDELLGGWGKIETDIGRNMANRVDSEDPSFTQLKEQFLSTQDRKRVEEACDYMIENNITKLAVGNNLLKNEIALLEEILKKKSGLELTKSAK